MISLPPLFEEDIKNTLGKEAEEFLSAIAHEIPTSIRLNREKSQSITEPVPSDIVESRIPWCEEGIYLKSRPIFTLDPLLHAGVYYVQEASSMFLDYVLRTLPIDRNVRILDLCAAPGGKSSLIANYIGNEGLLVSNEVIRSRAAILKENMQKWGSPNVVVTSNDPADFRALKGAFDVIVVDAPCSGEGMFRKDETARKEWSPANVKLCSERQQRILANIWDCLAPGGYLIYSTCTFNRQENEEIVEWMVDEWDASSIEIPHSFPSIASAQNSTCYGYHFYPHRTKGEGLFMAVVQKHEGKTWKSSSPNGKRKAKKTNPIALPKEIQSWIKDFDKYRLTEKEGIISIIPEVHADFIRALNDELRILSNGCNIIEQLGKKYKMQHAFAVSQSLDIAQVPAIELTREQALTYLKKEDIAVDRVPEDWCLVTYKGIGLGWIKGIGNRINNYYPKEWRILMNIK